MMHILSFRIWDQRTFSIGYKNTWRIEGELSPTSEMLSRLGKCTLHRTIVSVAVMVVWSLARYWCGSLWYSVVL